MAVYGRVAMPVLVLLEFCHSNIILSPEKTYEIVEFAIKNDSRKRLILFILDYPEQWNLSYLPDTLGFELQYIISCMHIGVNFQY